MTEDEELRLALEESKKEAEKAKLQTTSQWSSVARQTSSTQQSTATGPQSANSTPVKPKPAPTTTPIVANSSPKVSVPARPATNPWGNHAGGATNTYSNIVASSKPVDSSAASTEATATTNVQTATNAADAASSPTHAPDATTSTQSSPRHYDVEEEEEEFDDDEMLIAPVASRSPPSTVATPIKPIARPIATTHAFTSSTDAFTPIHHTLDANDERLDKFETSRSSTHNYDATSTTTMSTSTFSSGLSSPAPQALNSAQQLADRIAKLENENQHVMARMRGIIDASVHLEEIVKVIATENLHLKSQVSELTAQVKSLSATPTNTQASDPAPNILSAPFYSPFFPMAPYGNQGMGTPFGAGPTHVNAPYTTNGYLG